VAIFWILLGAALVVAISIFHAQNPLAVDLSLYGYPAYGVPLWLLVAVPAVVGLVLGMLMGLPDRFRAAFRERRLANTLRERDKTIGQLQQRVAEIERDLAVARRAERDAGHEIERQASRPVIVEREVPAGVVTVTRTGTRTDLDRAA
jgi:uncharacterized integral membrane protein